GHDGAVGNREHEVVAVGTPSVVPHPRAPVRGPPVRPVVVVEQRGGRRVDHERDVAPAAAVAAVRAAQRLELLPVDGDAAVPAGPRADVQDDTVDERGHRVPLGRSGGGVAFIVQQGEDGRTRAGRPSSRVGLVDYPAATTLTTRRPRCVPNSTWPGTRANNVSSPPLPTP